MIFIVFIVALFSILVITVISFIIYCIYSKRRQKPLSIDLELMNLQKEKQKSHQEDDLFDIQTVSNDFFNIGFIPKSPKSDFKYCGACQKDIHGDFHIHIKNEHKSLIQKWKAWKTGQKYKNQEDSSVIS